MDNGSRGITHPLIDMTETIGGCGAATIPTLVIFLRSAESVSSYEQITQIAEYSSLEALFADKF